MDELTKKKISAKMRGHKKSATTINKIKNALKGRKLTKEHKENISKAMKEKYKEKNNSLNKWVTR